jgi:hypothetical protein
LLKIKTIGLKLLRARAALVVLGWGTCLANLAVTAIAYGVLAPRAQYYSQATSTQTGLLLFALYYVGVFGVSLLSGFVLESISTALVGFFCSYVLAMVLTGLILDLPVVTGFVPQAFEANLATGIIFTAFFPFALIVGLMGALLGAAPADT